ncbi:hypothetical protein ACF068_29250 [Streptomyces sp. NPDC016309]|uniref:hypothetical protein n=1 Tax=Streptomyces sp. NPDC016309 TaxID=3364965 RepID=UPI0036FC1168
MEKRTDKAGARRTGAEERPDGTHRPRAEERPDGAGRTGVEERPDGAGRTGVEEWLTVVFGEVLDVRDAVAEFRALLRKVPEGTAERLTAQLAELARHAHESADGPDAVTLLALLDVAADATGTRAARFTAALEQGLYFLRAGLPGDSVPRFAEALELAGSAQDRCRAVFHSGAAWMELGDAAEAEGAFRQASVLATEADDIEGLVQAANRLAALATWRNAPGEADGIVDFARARAEQAGRTDLVLHLMMVSGVRFAYGGEWDRAEEEYLRLAERARARGSTRDAGEGRAAEAAALSGRITLGLRRQDLTEAERLAPRLRALLPDVGASEAVRDLIRLSQVGMLLGDQDGALKDAVRAVELSAGERLRPEQTEALAQLSSVHLARGAYEPAHRTCVAALRLVEDSRATVGDARSRLAFVEDRSELYEQVVQLCLVLADTLQDPAYLTEALTWVERGKSRTLGELLGLGTVPAPAGVPAAVLEAEHELVRRVRTHESAGGLSRDEYHEAWRRLEALWREMEDEAPDYVALRRGRSARPDEIRDLLAGAGPTAGRCPGAAGTGGRSRPVEPAPRLRPYGTAREVDLELPEGGRRPVLILAGPHTDSRRRLLDRVGGPAPVGERLVELVANLAAIDAAWWSRFGTAVDQGRVPDGERLGRWLRRCVARWGSEDQCRAAERWDNDRLVSQLCRGLPSRPPDEASWTAVGTVLRKDRTAAEACRVLHDRRLLPEDPGADARLAREEDRLTGYFFVRLAQEVRDASRSGPPGAATARFRLGLRAAVRLVPGDAHLFAAGAGFVEEFPEHRYA